MQISEFQNSVAWTVRVIKIRPIALAIIRSSEISEAGSDLKITRVEYGISPIWGINTRTLHALLLNRKI